jgi:D-alanyl-D-alanine carboxypeptidase
MKNSTFENPHGLDSNSKNITTVYDMALVMGYALENETFREITKTKSYNPKIASGKQMYFTNKHRLIKSETNVTGGKTGFTKSARRTLVTSFKEDDFEIVVVTFNCNDDFNFHKIISRNIFDKYNYKTVFNKTKLNLTLKQTINYKIKKSDLKVPFLEGELVKYQINKTETFIEVVYYFPNGETVIKKFEEINE